MPARAVREPERTCVGCRRSRPKNELIRLVRSADGGAIVDVAGRAPGRGAYVCSQRCAERGKRRLAGALRSDNVDFEQIARGLPV
jgi:uncharacterized protein